MKHIIITGLFISITILFNFFSLFNKLEENNETIKIFIFTVIISIFLFFIFIFLKKYTIDNLIKPIFMINFVFIFLLFTTISDYSYRKIAYYSFNNYILKENFKMPTKEYKEFLIDYKNNNKEKLYFYINNKNYLLSIEEDINNQIIKFINESKSKELRSFLYEISNDDVITIKEFLEMKNNFILNYSKIKEDENLKEIYKIIFVFGLKYN